MWEGVRTPEGRTFRLRMNSILNGCTRRGPFLGNTLAVLGELKRLANSQPRFARVSTLFEPGQYHCVYNFCSPSPNVQSSGIADWSLPW